jgi:hypothetical protein
MRSIATGGCASQRGTLRMRVPFGERARCGDHEACGGGGVLEHARAPASERRLDRRALGVWPGRKAEQAQRAVAVVGKVGVHAHPAVAVR